MSTTEIVKYLEDNEVTKVLNGIVNDMCKVKPKDAYGYLSKRLRKLQKPVVAKLVGREILDSRGNPTVQTDVYCLIGDEEEFVARGSAPSGASTGSNEALELRDKDPKRFLGKGVTKAVANVSGALSNGVKGLDPRNLKQLDEVLCKVDGTQLKTNIGGNAITSASFALARAGAALNNTQLFLHLASFFHKDVPKKFSLPRPMVNILNGGKHAGGKLQIQEFMIVPRGDIPFKTRLLQVTTVYHHLGKILVKNYGKSAKNLGDEGGFAPSLDDPNRALELIEEAIKTAGYVVGKDIFLALDSAASEFYTEEKKYEIMPNKFISTDEMVDFYLKMKKEHPALISIEDGLHETDYEGWKKLTAKFAAEYKDVRIIGDDLYTTNTSLISKGIANKWANSLLLKVNQIGTISEAMDAARMIFNDNGDVAVSHRSGETDSHLISDLAVAIGAQFIKTGATARGERVIKYNRLLQIEEYLEKHNLLK